MGCRRWWHTDMSFWEGVPKVLKCPFVRSTRTRQSDCAKKARNSLRKRAHLGLPNEGERARETTARSAVARHRLSVRAAGGGADFKNLPVCLIKPPSNVRSASRCRCTPQCTSMDHCLNRPRPLHLFNDRDWSILPGVRRDQPLVFSFPRSWDEYDEA